MIRKEASWEIFFPGGRVGEPITPHETHLRIKFMMHDQIHDARVDKST